MRPLHKERIHARERERERLGGAEEEEKEERAKGRLARGEKAREGAGQGSHRRLTRNYGFAGLTNKESARETGFAGRHTHTLFLSPTGTGPWNRLSPLKARKHRIRRHFGYRPPASADGTAAEFMATFGPSRWIPAREQPREHGRVREEGTRRDTRPETGGRVDGRGEARRET